MNEEATVTIKCTGCGMAAQAPAFAVGTKWACEACGTVFTIRAEPEADAAAAEEAEAENEAEPRQSTDSEQKAKQAVAPRRVLRVREKQVASPPAKEEAEEPEAAAASGQEPEPPPRVVIRKQELADEAEPAEAPETEDSDEVVELDLSLDLVEDDDEPVIELEPEVSEQAPEEEEHYEEPFEIDLDEHVPVGQEAKQQEPKPPAEGEDFEIDPDAPGPENEDVIYISAADVVDDEPSPRFEGRLRLETEEEEAPCGAAGDEQTEPELPPPVEVEEAATGGRCFRSRIGSRNAACYLCMAEDRKVHPRAVAPVIESITGINLHALFTSINRGTRILCEIEAKHAVAVAEAMRFQQTPCFVMDEELVPEMARPRRMQRGHVTAEGLFLYATVKEDNRSPALVPMENVLAICALANQTEEERYDLSSRSPKLRGTTFGNSRRKSANQQEFHVLIRRPGAEDQPVRRVQLDATGIDYDFLGDRKGTVTSENFRLFCKTVCEQAREQNAGRIFLPGGMLGFVAGGEQLPAFTTRVQIDWYHRWLLCCILSLEEER